MQNRSKSLKVKLVLIILFVDVCFIKYGTSAPRKSQLENDRPKVKRNAAFRNNLSSMIYKSFLNYADVAWNSQDAQPLTAPNPNYETNSIQYLNGNENNFQDDTFNWSDDELKKTNLLDTAHIKDNHVSDGIGKDCDYELRNTVNDLIWSASPQGIDESLFNDFYLVPEERGVKAESGTSTTSRPVDVEKTIQNRNNGEKEKTPNISVINCSSNRVQKEFLEKVLSDNDDEYLVLLIKRNPFFGSKQEGKEDVLGQPPSNETIPSLTVEIQQEADIATQHSLNETSDSSDTLSKDGDRTSEDEIMLGQPLSIQTDTTTETSSDVEMEKEVAFVQENTTKTGEDTNSTISPNPGENVDIYLSQNNGTAEDLEVSEKIDKPVNSTELVSDIEVAVSTESSTEVPTSTLPTTPNNDEDVTQLSNIQYDEEARSGNTTDFEKEVQIPITNIDKTDISEKINQAEENIKEVLKENDGSDNQPKEIQNSINSSTELPIEEKTDSAQQTPHESPNSNLDERTSINTEDQDSESTSTVNSEFNNLDETSTPVVVSTIDDVENTQGNTISTSSNPNSEDQVEIETTTTTTTTLLEDAIVSTTLSGDQKVDVEETTTSATTEQNNFESSSQFSSTNSPSEVVETTPSEKADS